MRKKVFITWVTYNSRYSERMKMLKIKKGEGIFFDKDDRILIYNLICNKLEKEGIKDFTLNVLSDHVHLVFMYEENKLSNIIKNIKGFTSFQYSRIKNITKVGIGEQNRVWASGFSLTYLDTEKHIQKAIDYTFKNHEKHNIENILQLVNKGF